MFANSKFFLGSSFPTYRLFDKCKVLTQTQRKFYRSLDKFKVSLTSMHPSPGVAAKKMTKAEWPSKQGVVSVVQLDDLSLCSLAAAMYYCTSEGRVGSQVPSPPDVTTYCTYGPVSPHKRHNFYQDNLHLF